MTDIVFASAARSMQARARIRDHVYRTPLIPARGSYGPEGTSLLFKAENFQLTGSFKIRGAASVMTAAEPGQKRGDEAVAAVPQQGRNGSQTARSE